MSEDIIKKLIQKMFEKQDELNVHTNGLDWKQNKNLKWYRAIWTECAELIDYTDWKWWKKEDFKLDDIKIELIDIWHFIMSEMMKNTDIDTCVGTTIENFKCLFEKDNPVSPQEIQSRTEELAFFTLRNCKCCIEEFVKLCSSVNMDIEDIYKLYMGKNILNRFRQDFNYKKGTYKKIWNGKEDNFYLIQYINNIQEIDNNFGKKIYDHLKECYEKWCIDYKY